MYQAIDQHEPMLKQQQGAPVPSVEPIRMEKSTSKCNDPFFAVLFLLQVVGIGILAFYKGIEALDGFEKIQKHDKPKDMTNIYIICIGLVGTGVVLSAIWMRMLMLFAENMIRFALWLNVGMMFVFAITTMFVNPFMPFIFLFMAMINICYIYAVQNRIGFASAHLKISCAAISEHCNIFFAAFFLLILQVIWLGVWALSAIGVYQLFRESDPNCSKEEAQGEVCGGAGAGVALFFMLVCVFWGQQVITNVLTCTTSGTVATWWYQQNSKNAVSGSLYRSLTTSFGSICFGSLIVAILQALRTVANMIKNKAMEDDNPALACVACICECILNCIESIMEYFNMWAYTYVGIYGYDFRTSGKAVMDLFNNRGWTAVINDDLASTALNIGSFGIGLLTGCVGLLVARFAPVTWFSALGTEDAVIRYVVFGIIGFIAGMSMAVILANLVVTGLHTIFVCFAEDPNAFQNSHPEHYSDLVVAWRQFHPDALVTAYGSYV